MKKVAVEFVDYYEPEDDFQGEVQGKEYLQYFMALNIVYYY